MAENLYGMHCFTLALHSQSRRNSIHHLLKDKGYLVSYAPTASIALTYPDILLTSYPTREAIPHLRKGYGAHRGKNFNQQREADAIPTLIGAKKEEWVPLSPEEDGH